jgi:hypothetical protein
MLHAQAIMMGHILPLAQCANIEPLTFQMATTPAEPGWGNCTFAFAISRDQLHVVVDFVHEESIDRGNAVAKMRRTVRNLTNWFLTAQTLFSDSSLSFGPDQAIAKYDGEEGWTSHLEPSEPSADQAPLPTTQHVFTGGSILPYITKDSLLMYALQDYASAVANPEFSLFLLWRSLEWILWEYDTSDKGRSPHHGPAESALSLPPKWISRIGALAHNYVRHARRREPADPRLIAAAKERVRSLILRHVRVAHGFPDKSLPEIGEDALTSWSYS